MEHAGSLEAAAFSDGGVWASLGAGKSSNNSFFRYDDTKSFNASWKKYNQYNVKKKRSLPAASFKFAKTSALGLDMAKKDNLK